MNDESLQQNEGLINDPESLDEGGQEILVEEVDELDEEDPSAELVSEAEKTGHPPHSHVVLWLAVALSIIAIMVGWLFFTKQSFLGIDNEVKNQNTQSNDQLQSQLQTTFTELGKMLDTLNENVDALKAKDAVRQKEAAQLNAAGKSVAGELKAQQ